MPKKSNKHPIVTTLKKGFSSVFGVFDALRSSVVRSVKKTKKSKKTNKSKTTKRNKTTKKSKTTKSKK
jgi:hypothetical protein